MRLLILWRCNVYVPVTKLECLGLGTRTSFCVFSYSGNQWNACVRDRPSVFEQVNGMRQDHLQHCRMLEQLKPTREVLHLQNRGRYYMPRSEALTPTIHLRIPGTDATDDPWISGSPWTFSGDRIACSNSWQSNLKGGRTLRF